MADKIATSFMLDTNMVSHFIKGSLKVCNKVVSVPMSCLTISAITEGEILFGLAKKPEATQLKLVVHEFLIRSMFYLGIASAFSQVDGLKIEDWTQ